MSDERRAPDCSDDGEGRVALARLDNYRPHRGHDDQRPGWQGSQPSGGEGENWALFGHVTHGWVDHAAEAFVMIEWDD